MSQTRPLKLFVALVIVGLGGFMSQRSDPGALEFPCPAIACIVTE